MLSHVSSVDPLPLSGAVARIASYPSPMPPLQQQHIQPMQFPLLTEEHFMEHFMQFSEATGITLNEQDFMIDGRQVNPWALHRVVSARNGFDSVTANDEWPMVGAVLGFPPVSSWNPARLSYCGPAVAHRLQQLYQVSLRLFDQSYINSVIAGWRSSQTSGQGQGQITFHPPQRQTQSRPLTEVISILPPRTHPVLSSTHAVSYSTTSLDLWRGIERVCIARRKNKTKVGSGLVLLLRPRRTPNFLTKFSSTRQTFKR
ncbi:hypothetical protein BJV74DRAFT_177389 [Russula compacta]|nr:hypothetical protein BJV74DRAFT_177389 [Russula compacta]